VTPTGPSRSWLRIGTIAWEGLSLLSVSIAVIALYLPGWLEQLGWVLIIFGMVTVVLRWTWWLSAGKRQGGIAPYAWLRPRGAI
jgi:hypothetical protein